MDLFTLKSAIKDKTILCIPFSLKIPNNFPVSYSQNLDLNNNGGDIMGLELKRIQVLKNRKEVNYSGFVKKTIQKFHQKFRGNRIIQKKKNDKSRYGMEKSFKVKRMKVKKKDLEYDSESKNKLEMINEEEEMEQISIEHTVMVIFVNTEDAKQGKEDLLEDSLEDVLIENNEEGMKNAENLGDMQALDQFVVFQRMDHEDFNKFYMESIIPISYKFSLKNFLRCNFLKRKDLQFPIKISLDRLTFRHSDSSINMVIKYPNQIMHYFRFIDIILVGRYVIKNNHKTGSNVTSKAVSRQGEPLSKKASEIGETDDNKSQKERDMKGPIMIFGSNKSPRSQ